MLLGYERSDFSSVGFLTWRPPLTLRRSTSALKLYINHGYQYDSSGHSKGPRFWVPNPSGVITCSLPDICNWDWKTLVFVFTGGCNLRLCHLKNYGPVVLEKAQSRSSVWSRDKVWGRSKGRDHVAPGRGWESIWLSQPHCATALEFWDIPGSLPYNKSPFLNKIVLFLVTDWIWPRIVCAFVLFERKRGHSFHQILKSTHYSEKIISFCSI